MASAPHPVPDCPFFTTKAFFRLLSDHRQTGVGQHRQRDAPVPAIPPPPPRTGPGPPLSAQGQALPLGLLEAFFYGSILIWPSGFRPSSTVPPAPSRTDRSARSRRTLRVWQRRAGSAASSPCPVPPGGRISTAAQPQTRGPLAPSPALRPSSRIRQPATPCAQPAPPVEPRAGSDGAPLSVKAHSFSLLLMASTWGIPSRSSHSRRLRSLPQTSSPATQLKGTPDSSARSSISCASWGLVRNATLLRHPGLPPALPVLRPYLGQVQFPVQQSPPPGTGIGQEYANWTVLDPARRTAVLPRTCSPS